MQVAICDDDVTDRVKVGELLAQKMRKRGEPLEIIYFDCGEDLVDPGRFGAGTSGLHLYFSQPAGSLLLRGILSVQAAICSNRSSRKRLMKPSTGSLQNAIPGCGRAFWWSTEAPAGELPMMISCILKAGG